MALLSRTPDRKDGTSAWRFWETIIEKERGGMDQYMSSRYSEGARRKRLWKGRRYSLKHPSFSGSVKAAALNRPPEMSPTSIPANEFTVPVFPPIAQVFG